LHAIAKIERLRTADQAFDALLDVLTAASLSEGKVCAADKTVSSAHIELIDAVAARVQHSISAFVDVSLWSPMEICTYCPPKPWQTETAPESSAKLVPQD